MSAHTVGGAELNDLVLSSGAGRMCAVRDASLRELVGDERAEATRTELRVCGVSCPFTCKEIISTITIQ